MQLGKGLGDGYEKYGHFHPKAGSLGGKAKEWDEWFAFTDSETNGPKYILSHHPCGK